MRITALLPTHNDELRLGRCLELLHPCDEILIVDCSSTDKTRDVAREYGAKVVRSRPDLSPQQLIREGWILCLNPNESLTEALAASLYELKLGMTAFAATAYSMFLREETVAGWIDGCAPETRLVPAGWADWDGLCPTARRDFPALEGALLRFTFP